MLRQVTEEENKSIATDKFSKKAFGYWKRFGMFEKNAPWALIEDNKILAICHITSSKRTKYCNLYYIQSIEKGKGYGQILFDSLCDYFINKGMQRIKLSSEPEALDFWCNKNFFYFWSYDKYLSLKADAPLFKTILERNFHRAYVHLSPQDFIPPITKHLIHPPLTDKQMMKLVVNSSKIEPYKYFDVIKHDGVTQWISE